MLLYSFSVKKKKTRRCIHFSENEKHTNFAYFSFLIYTYKKKFIVTIGVHPSILEFIPEN